MDWVPEVIKAVFGRVWFTSFSVMLFCVGANVVPPMFNLEIPNVVMEWVNVGLLASMSILLTQSIFSIGALVRKKFVDWREGQGSWENARLNISALFPREAATLRSLLSDTAPERFTVSPKTETLRPLLDKGVLVVHHEAGASGLICSVAPSIRARRHEIVEMLPTLEQVKQSEEQARIEAGLPSPEEMARISASASRFVAGR